MDNSLLHSSFYQALEHLVILTCFECLIQRFSMMVTNPCVISRIAVLYVRSINVTNFDYQLVNKFFLFFTVLIIVVYLPYMNSSLIMMFTIK